MAISYAISLPSPVSKFDGNYSTDTMESRFSMHLAELPQ
jgi:hypothetical protein